MAAGVVTRELGGGGRPADIEGDEQPVDAPDASPQPDGEAGADGLGATEARDGGD